MNRKMLVMVTVIMVLLEALTLWQGWGMWCSFVILAIFSIYSFICNWKLMSIEKVHNPQEQKKGKRVIKCLCLITIFLLLAIVVALIWCIFDLSMLIICISLPIIAIIIGIMVHILFFKKERDNFIPDDKQDTTDTVPDIGYDLESIRSAVKRGEL